MLCCSIVVGAGMQGLICAGLSDRKWILFSTIVMGTLAIATLLPATPAGLGFQTLAGLTSETGALFTETAKMYALGATPMAILFFVVRAGLRMHALRLLILCAAMAMDIFLGARFIIDTILFL
jgi:hypothetical protein